MFKTILAAVDGSAHARKAVECASDLAKLTGAKLVLVHVAGHGPVPASLAHMAEVEHLATPARPPLGNVANVVGGLAAISQGVESSAFTQEVRLAIGRKMLNDSRARAGERGAPAIEMEMAEGEPVAGIIETAGRTGADLIVMGTRGLSDFKGLLLGSVSHKVCQLASCPCLTVK